MSIEILVVEDDKQLAHSLSLLLAEHSLTLANSGREAIARCTERDYDMILCDLFMAEMSGMDAYDAIQRIRPGLERRMVFMTGGAFTSRAQQFLDSVPNPILEKPFQPGDLLRVLEEIGTGGAQRPS